MCSYLGFFVLACLAVCSTNAERVSCRQVRRDNGNIAFDCVSVVPPVDLSVQNLYILWLRSTRAGGDQSIAIDVPNYRIEDLIQAAAKGGQSESRTNINVNLRPPELSYLAQKEERVGQTSQTFDVNLQYEPIRGKSVHFADEGVGSERYAPLYGTIPEPQGWSSRIQDLIQLTARTFTDIGGIAVEDNPEVGRRIVNTLNGELDRANRIFTDYTASLSSGGRFKRAADNGGKALNDVGDVLVGADKKIDADKKKLGPDAQKKVNKKHRDALGKCTADPCKSASKALQDADEGERQ